MSNQASVLPQNGESYFKKIFLFSLPLMLSSMLQMLYNAADLMVVGQFEGEVALAAVGSTGALTGLILNLFIGLSVGVGVCVAHGVGAGNAEDVRRSVHTSILLALIMGVAVGIFGYFFAPQMLILMDTPENVIEHATVYVKIIFLGSPASLLYNYTAAILRSAGDSKRPLIFLSISGLANVLLNLLLVAVFGIGIAGVAIATVTAQALSAVMMLIYMAKRGGMVHFSFHYLRIYGKNLKKMLVIGIPSGVQTSLFSFSNVIIQSSINSFGSTVMAGSAASANVEGLFSVIYSSLGTAAVTFVGQAVGAKRTNDVKKIVFNSLGVIFACAVVLVPIAFILRKPLLSIYVSDGGAVLEEALVRFSVMLLPTVLCGVVDLGSGALRGLGRSAYATVVSLICVFVFRWLWMIIVFPMYPTPTVIYLATVVSRALNAVFNYVLLFVFTKKHKKRSRLEATKCLEVKE